MGPLGALTGALGVSNSTNYDTGYGELQGTLKDWIAGRGPNLAEEQRRVAMNDALQSQAGLVAGARGVSPGLAAEIAARSGGEAAAKIGAQSAMQRMTQQMAAAQQMAELTRSAMGANAAAAAQNADINAKVLGGAMGGAGGAMGMGSIPKFAAGGAVGEKLPVGPTVYGLGAGPRAAPEVGLGAATPVASVTSQPASLATPGTGAGEGKSASTGSGFPALSSVGSQTGFPALPGHIEPLPVNFGTPPSPDLSPNVIAMAHGGEVPHLADGGFSPFMATDIPSLRLPSTALEPVNTPGLSALPYAPGTDMMSGLGVPAQKSNVGAALGGVGAGLTGGDSMGAFYTGLRSPMMLAEGGKVPEKTPPPEPKWQPPEYPLPEAGQLGYEGENAKVKIRPLDRPPTTGGSLPLYDYLGVGPKQKLAAGGSPVFMSDGTVPGQARVAGDSLQNDTVDAKLSPGEIVIPRSIAQSPNAPEEAASFVAHLIRRGGGGYDKVARAKGRKMADVGKVDETAEEAPPAEAAPSTESVVPSNAATRFVQHLSKLLGVKEQGTIRKRQELYKDVEEQTKDE